MTHNVQETKKCTQTEQSINPIQSNGIKCNLIDDQIDKFINYFIKLFIRMNELYFSGTHLFLKVEAIRAH